MRVVVCGVALAFALAHAEGAEHHEFASTPLAGLQVIETRGDLAVVEGEQGEMALVHVDDLVGLEAARVDRISRGCLLLSGNGGRFSLCADAPATPRS